MAINSEEVETTPFTAEEQKILWEDYNAGNKFTGYLLLMIYTGMMPGELLKAKKSMIDWDKHEIVGCGLKTKKRKETPILLPDIILPVLDNLCEGEKDKLPPYRRDDFYTEYKATIERLGLNPISVLTAADTQPQQLWTKQTFLQQSLKKSCAIQNSVPPNAISTKTPVLCLRLLMRSLRSQVVKRYKIIVLF